MIFDRVDNLEKYFEKEDFNKIKRFLELINDEMEEKRYEIDGERIYARVMSYETKHPEDCVIEAHNKYIDIQASIKGSEGIGVYERDSLTTSENYKKDKDVELFANSNVTCLATTINVPGYFTLLYPADAHSPKQKTLSDDKVKKYVIKVRTDVIR